VFPELAFVAGSAAAAQASSRDLAIEPADLPFFIRVTQLMEDTWIACELDKWWDHPLNLGWVNLYARWATAPSFRFWWPLLSPMYSPGFNSFINQRFPIPAKARGIEGALIKVPQSGRVERLVRNAGHTPGLAEVWWTHRSAQPANWERRALYQNLAQLPRVGGEPLEIQVGLAAVTLGPDVGAGNDVGWTSDAFFIPPSLWGVGFGWHFLDGLLKALTGANYTECYVVVKGVPHDAQHQIALDDRRSFIQQYRKMGFRQQTTAENTELLCELGYDPEADTLFTMNLSMWNQRRGGASIAKQRAS
jgi:hypothetical protein